MYICTNNRQGAGVNSSFIVGRLSTLLEVPLYTENE